MTRRRRKKQPQPTPQWYRADVHIHTPASADYQQRGVSYLNILQEAERRGLDILAFTDHNTINGYREMQKEIESLQLLADLGRLQPEEEQRLNEYNRLLGKLLLLRGFEFTATFGFHILGLFPPDIPFRDLEFLLLKLNLPGEKLDDGATEVGATSDVLTAYRLIDEAGGIVIAAHANTTHGVALQGIQFGGQTRIAFTQDPHLHALEVTDLDKSGRRATARFFDGSKPEYPRRMRCIQSSDAHRLAADPNNPRNLGIGDRPTEILLSEKSFAAIREVFRGDDFARTRPYRAAARPFDYIQAAREEGPNIVQEFHERYSRRGGYLDAILANVCAFANTNGGTLYIGVQTDPQKPPTGVGASPNRVMNLLAQEIAERITPALKVTTDVQETRGVKIVRIVVPRGPDPPYTLDESQLYIRTEAETSHPVRDEIVELVRRGIQLPVADDGPKESTAALGADDERVTQPPRTGVEIASVEEREGTRYYTMRDLRNGNLVKNVTRRSARRLWRYAIEEAETHPVKSDEVHWFGDIGIWKQREHGNTIRYDLVQQAGDRLRVYYGVTEEGAHGKWLALLEDERPAPSPGRVE